MVLEADAAKRRILLSVNAIAAAAVSDCTSRNVAAQTQSFGSLAGKLRGALSPKK